MLPQILTTKQLLLRPFERSDAAAVLTFNGNAEVQRYTGDKVTKTLEEALHIIEEIWFRDYATYGYGRLAAVAQESGAVIGFAGLKYLPELDATDLGFRFLPEYWGRGLATEAGRCLLEHGLHVLKLNEVIAMAQTENGGSCRVLEKIGMDRYQTAGYKGGDTLYHWYRKVRTS